MPENQMANGGAINTLPESAQNVQVNVNESVGILLENDTTQLYLYTPGLASQEGETYMKFLEEKSGIKILQAARVRRAFQSDNVFGLFRLFFPLTEIERVRQMTNSNSRLKKPVTFMEMKEHLGLELAMSLNSHNHVSDYWSLKMFIRQPDFPTVMSRNRFQKIR